MKHKQAFTLIEVMIALAIIALALSAALLSGKENIRNLAYLQKKNLALMVANNESNRLLTGSAGYYLSAGNYQGKITMGNSAWQWSAKVSYPEETQWLLEMRVGDASSGELMVVSEYMGQRHQHQ